MKQKITPTAAIFSLSLFLSAGLLFAVQPLTGKLLLPLVGGTPAGWVVSMAFFQIALLVGYGISYGLGRMPVRWHGVGYLVLLCIGAFFLPVGLGSIGTVDVSQQPMMAVILMLGTGVAVPFIALATSGPTLQRLYSASKSTDANDPYYLYAASNLGSFFGLLSYPFLVEPFFELPRQSILWGFGYGGLALLGLICLVLIIRHGQTPVSGTVTEETHAAPVTAFQRLKWVLYAAIPSSLILGVTTKITTDVASAPLIWILPLSLYLLTMVMAFAKKRRYDATLLTLIVPFLVMLVLSRDAYHIGRASFIDFSLSIVCFSLLSLYLHHQLAASRPPVKKLTEFYFFMSLGGALGGALNAFVAPVLFSWYWEYPAMLLLGLLMIPKTLMPIDKSKVINLFIAFTSLIIIGLFFIFLMIPEGDLSEKKHLIKIIVGVSFTLLMVLCIFPRYLAFVLLILCIGNDIDISHKALDRSRSFFGISKINDNTDKDGLTIRSYIHGTTLHGMQRLTPQISIEPTTYYTRNGPAGDYMTIDDPKQIALVGLGAGNLLCYQSPNRQFTVFEIDQTVIDLAHRWFTYISECGEPTFVVGDGRLKIAESNKIFNLIVIDAFSSDAVPVHLLTTEALKIYLNHLAPNGRLMLHITNRYINLAPPIAGAAKDLGLAGAVKLWTPDDKDNPNLGSASHYILLARNATLTAPFLSRGWVDLASQPIGKAWTDSYSNILLNLKNPYAKTKLSDNQEDRK